MADLLGTDEFLVNRNDITYTQQQDTLMASLETTDYLLINRAGQTYKITGGELIDSVIDPLELTVVLNPTEGYKGVEVTAIPVVSGGKQPDGGYIFTYQWVTATDAAGTDKTAIAGETGATFTPDDAQLGLYLGCVVSTTDALGTSAEGEAYIGPIQVRREAPVIADVEVSEIYDGANRFTDKEFPYVTTMAIDGEPAPTYELKAKVSGTTFDFNVKSDTIIDVEDLGGGQVQLTVDGDTDLADMTGEVFMTDGTGTPGPYSQTPYKLVTSQITDVDNGELPLTDPSRYTGELQHGGTVQTQVAIAEIFNGEVNDRSWTAPNNTTFTYTFPSGVTWNNSIKIYGAKNGPNGVLAVNDVPVQDLIATSDSTQLNDITSALGTSGTLTKWVSTIDNTGAGVAAFELDGKVLKLPENQVTLTFADPCPDLQYFKVDDVVQGLDLSGLYEIRVYTGTSLTPQSFDSTTFVDKIPLSQTTTSTLSGSQLLYDLEIPAYFEAVHAGGPLNNPGGTFYFYGSHDGITWTEEATASALNGPNSHPHTRLTSSTKYRYYMLRREDGGVARNMGADVYIPDISSYETATKVIAPPDVANRKLTVDGGNWTTGEEPRTYSQEQYTLSVPTGDWAAVFSSKEIAEGGYIQWGPTDTGTSGSGNATYDADGAVVAHFDPPLNGTFKMSCQWSNNQTNAAPGTLIVDADSTSLTPTPESSFGSANFVEMDYGTVTNLRSVGMTANSIGAGTSIAAFYLNGVKLIDEEAGQQNKVEYETKGGKGTIVSVDEAANTITLTGSADRDERWIANNSGEGSGTSTDFYVTPANAVPIQQDEAWCKLQIINNKAQVTGIQQDDPGFLPVPAKDYSIKFPSAFGTGNEPDVDLPKGTCVAAIVAAENSEGRSEKESNCFMPIDVNPAGAAGPITDSTPTTLTVASNVNLSNFSLGDSLVMVNEDNDISNYTMQTSQIIDIEQLTGALTTYIGWAGFGAMDWANDVSWSSLPVGTGVGQGGATPEKRAESKELNDGVNILEIGDYGLGDKGSNGWVIDMGEVVQATISPKLDNIDWLVSIVTTDTADQTFAQGKVFTEKVGNQIFGVGRYFWMTNNVAADGPNLKVEVHYPTTLTFADPCPDLKFFRVGDVVQSELEDGTGVSYQMSASYNTGSGTQLLNPSNLPDITNSNAPFTSGWLDVNYGDNPAGVPLGGSNGNHLIHYYKFDQPFKPTFGYYNPANPSEKASANSSWKTVLAYWNEGTGNWIIDAVTNEALGNGTSLIATAQHDLWIATRLVNSEAVVGNSLGTTTSGGASPDAGSFGPMFSTYYFIMGTAVAGANPPVKVIAPPDVANRKLTVDGGDWDPTGVNGDDRVTYGPVTGTGTFQSADLDNNIITLSTSNDRWIDNTNRLGTNFYVRDNITVLNADNPKHVAIQEAIADAFAAFPSNVNDRRTAIASSLYRLYAGENISANEFQLLEEVVSNAVNAVEPFALDGYYPLYYTAAKANAASSEGTHHTHTINGITYYMPDGGTLYHGNYI